MSTINTRIKSKRDTTANWDNARGFVPMEGELIIYLDYLTEKDSEGNDILQQDKDSEGNLVYDSEGNPVMVPVLIPGIKVGDGKAYVQDLPFIDQDLRTLVGDHIANELIHVSLSDRQKWNNKIDLIDDGQGGQPNYGEEETSEGWKLKGEVLYFDRL